MTKVLVTGSSGLIGNETVRFFAKKKFEVIGIDNNFRKLFFGQDGDTESISSHLQSDFDNFSFNNGDIRDAGFINTLFENNKGEIDLIIHAAAQPSHDWAARNPLLDFEVNSLGTLNLLEATRLFMPNAVFIYMSTNKVYGDISNSFEYSEGENRYSLERANPFFQYGFNESLPIDQSLHSLFGVSKLSADLLTQEYGRYFGLKTTVLRGGCLSGPTHQGAELHGFLSYLVKCAYQNKHYTVFGYKGKQVRDNLHSIDVVQAFWEIFNDPKVGEVYNIGGSIYSNISIREAINYLIEKSFNLSHTFKDDSRLGDHKWWISDVRKFQTHYPNWEVTRNAFDIIDETVMALKS